MTRYLLRADALLTDEATGADAIITRDDRIEAIGRYEQLGAAASEATVVDLRGCHLVPGFIDTHVHITGNGRPDAPVEIQTASDELLLLRASANARTALQEGVTTVRDLGAHNHVILAFRDIANAGVVPAPHMLVAGAPLTRTGGHGHWWGLEADSDLEIVRAVRRQSKAGVDALKVMVDGGIDLGRHLPGLLYFPPDDLQVAVEQAHDWGLRVAAHCLTASGVRSAVAAGVDSIEHAIFYELDREDTRYDPELGESIVQRGIYVAPGPAFAHSVFTQAGAEQGMFARNAQLFHKRLADDTRLHEQGVPIVAGTDAGWYGTPFGRYALAAQLLVEESRLPPAVAFAGCTGLAAASLGIERETGALTTGLRADIVALQGDPRVDIRAMTRVRMTMARGRVFWPGSVESTPPLGASALST